MKKLNKFQYQKILREISPRVICAHCRALGSRFVINEMTLGICKSITLPCSRIKQEIPEETIVRARKLADFQCAYLRYKKLVKSFFYIYFQLNTFKYPYHLLKLLITETVCEGM